MSNLLAGNHLYSFFGLLFQSSLCFLVIVFIQSLVRLQNDYAEASNDTTVSAHHPCGDSVTDENTRNPNRQSLEASSAQTMSEDRHTLSEPRLLSPATPQAEAAVAEARLMHPKLPASGSGPNKMSDRPFNGPVFLVDVYRTGVDDPVDTVVITDETLPPRKNKKGKVAWRLPDLESAKGGRLPSFGSDERKRIFDLFKERKRNRKKLLKKTSTASSVVSGMSAAESNAASSAASGSTVTGPDSGDGRGGAGSGGPASTTSVSQGWSRGRIKTADENNDLVSEEVSVSTAEAGRRGDDGGKAAGAAEENDAEKSPVSPSENSKKRPTKRGGKKNRKNKIDGDGPENKENGAEKEAASSDIIEASAGRDALDSPLPLKSIVVPKADRPVGTVLDPNPSMSVPAAKAFIDLYYPHVTRGSSDDLAMYYSPGAQKSVSIGGAHSVVTGRDSIQLQIASFVGSHFVVKSVVAQNTIGDGAFVLITGVVQTSPSAGSQISTFAHSVNLVSAASAGYSSCDPGASFVIHNDALMLMKMASEPIPPPPPPPQTPLGMGTPFGTNVPSQFQQQHPQQQQQQQQAPPPGLLPPGFGGGGRF